MEIKFQFNGRVFSITVGHQTKWFGQLDFINIQELEYNDSMEVIFARIIF